MEGGHDANSLADFERRLPPAPTHKPIAVNEDDVKKLIGLTKCTRGEARSALCKNDHNVSFALIDIGSAKEHASFSTPSKKPSAAGSSNPTTPAKSSCAQKRPCDMNKEELREHRRSIERKSKKKSRAKAKERRRALEEKLEAAQKDLKRATAIMSPAQKKQMMLREYTDVAQGMVEVAKKLANLNEDAFATLDDEETQGVAYDSESDASNNDNEIT